jgi:menaquinone-dependent protoporphyrinogen oxidase
VRALVATASRHGATREIAAAIAAELREAGIEVDERDVEGLDSLEGYDAVVLGSAVYVGRWLRPARRIVEEHAPELSGRPVWLFSSGPLGDPPRPEGDEAVDVAELMRATGAREHRIFPGRLDRDELGLRERAVVKVVGAAEGDFRDWDAVGEWARGIAGALRA